MLFGNTTLHEPSFIEELDQAPKNATPISIRSYVEDFMQRQGKLLHAAMRSQEVTNEKNLRKRNANYTRLPELHRRLISDTIQEEHEEPRDSPISIAHLFSIKVKPVQPIFMTKKWIV